MATSTHSRPRSRAANLHGFKLVLDRIDAHLQRAYPDFEQAKIDKVMLLLFGPEPSGFIVPEDKRYLSDPTS
jgi:hypothetical protein